MQAFITYVSIIFIYHRKLGILFTNWGSFSLFFNWEKTCIWTQRLHKSLHLLISNVSILDTSGDKNPTRPLVIKSEI